MVKTDLYYKKSLDFWHDGVSLTFRVSQSLFSSHQIDTGTQRLLKSLQTLSIQDGVKILDLGCGYGTIGLTMAKRYPGSVVHMVDRDALAVDYTIQNASLNGLDQCTVYGSLGYDDVNERDFDIIISNIPGKAGDSVITSMLEDTRYYIGPGGAVAIVVVAPLEALVSSVLDQPNINVLYRGEFKGYVVFHYQFVSPSSEYPEKTSLEKGIYHRASMAMSVSNNSFDIETVYGLPEFDSLDYQTDLVIKALTSQMTSSAKRVLIYNPGQGYLPAILWKLFKPNSIILVSRDLLSIRNSSRNLLMNGCPDESIMMVHQTGWGLQEMLKKLAASNTTGIDAASMADCVVAILRQDEGPDVAANSVKQATGFMQSDGLLYVAGGSTPITRLLKSIKSDKRLLLKKRRKHKGRSLALFQRRN